MPVSHLGIESTGSNPVPMHLLEKPTTTLIESDADLIWNRINYPVMIQLLKIESNATLFESDAGLKILESNPLDLSSNDSSV